jgi:hypothetical protein
VLRHLAAAQHRSASDAARTPMHAVLLHAVLHAAPTRRAACAFRLSGSWPVVVALPFAQTPCAALCRAEPVRSDLRGRVRLVDPALRGRPRIAPQGRRSAACKVKSACCSPATFQAGVLLPFPPLRRFPLPLLRLPLSLRLPLRVQRSDSALRTRRPVVPGIRCTSRRQR